MVTTLYLVRHGETEGNEIKRYKGSIDVPLSSNGEEQIRAASLFIQDCLQGASSSKHMSYLKDVHTATGKGPALAHADAALKAVYCSDLGRAVKSAGIIADAYGLKPVELPRLR